MNVMYSLLILFHQRIKKDYKSYHRKFDAQDRLTHLKASQVCLANQGHCIHPTQCANVHACV